MPLGSGWRSDCDSIYFGSLAVAYSEVKLDRHLGTEDNSVSLYRLT
jgi:hypothetical protein